MTTGGLGASARRARPVRAERDDAGHPLEESDRLAEQATTAVGLLERFGDLVTVALIAVGSGDDDALKAALAERERLMEELEPLLADLSAARHVAAATAGQNARAAIATILRPVDEALRHARLLHLRLTDEVDAPLGPTKPPLRLVS